MLFDHLTGLRNYQARNFDTCALAVFWPYVHLPAALGQLGRTDEALAAIEELRKRRPGLTVSAVRSWPHNRSRSKRSLEHILEGLRLAGLPEH